jgi:hypothetical protein
VSLEDRAQVVVVGVGHHSDVDASGSQTFERLVGIGHWHQVVDDHVALLLVEAGEHLLRRRHPEQFGRASDAVAEQVTVEERRLRGVRALDLLAGLASRLADGGVVGGHAETLQRGGGGPAHLLACRVAEQRASHVEQHRCDLHESHLSRTLTFGTRIIYSGVNITSLAVVATQ